MSKKAAQKAKNSKPSSQAFPVVIETFTRFDAWSLRNIERPEPSAFNGDVRVVKYRVTIEQIEEPVEAIHERIKKLWRECDNCHQWDPLRAEAKRHGLELDSNERGIARKGRP